MKSFLTVTGQVSGFLLVLAGVYLACGIPATMVVAGLMVAVGCTLSEVMVIRANRPSKPRSRDHLKGVE